MSDIASSRSIPRGTLATFGAFFALGVITFILGLVGDADTAKRTYRVFLHNWLMWAALAQGALVLSSACGLRMRPGRARSTAWWTRWVRTSRSRWFCS